MTEPPPYPRVFAPLRLGPVEVSNRVYFSAHSTPQGRTVSDDYVAYMEERAAGGVGLLVHSTSVTAVPGWAAPHHEASIPAYARVAEAVHRHGARLFGQMSYAWAWPLPWEPGAPERPWLAPSVQGSFVTPAVAREMTVQDIAQTVALYAAGAANFRAAGYDGVEIHVTHGSPIENFLSPYWNRRTDEYGGSVENRVRYVHEILDAVRDAAGPDLAVGLRFNCDEMLPGGYGQEEAREILAAICAGGRLDFVDLDIAVEPQQFTLGIPPYQLPKFLYEGYVRSVRAAAGDLPVLAALSRVTAVAEAERALVEGSCDMVGVTRGLIAEPQLVAHARAGNEALSRRCTACNHCIQQVIRGSFGCAINPATARERRWGAVAEAAPAPERRRVVVVGGGPAGLEAARVAAVRGHEVTLYEREPRLGGQYRLWSALPGREGHYDAIAWYGPELARLGVDVRTGVEADAGVVLGHEPDAAIVATGAAYVRTGESGFVPAPIPGADRDHVLTPEDVLERGMRPAGKVLVLDDEGLNAGVGVAEVLAKAGADVTFVTRWLHVAHELFDTFELPLITATLRNLGVTLRPQAYVREIGASDVTVYDVFTNMEDIVAGVGAVVLCTMRTPRAALATALEGRVAQLFAAGDASAPRDHATAFFEGALFARMIGAPGAPRTFTEAYFRTDWKGTITQ